MTARSCTLVSIAGLALSAPALADIEPHSGMLRYPDIGTDSIVFVYANDLWIVDRDGGEASPLASPPGGEMFPRFSPDSETIAFVGNYDGGRDLYTIPVAGGLPTRVTHHPTGEVLCDWTPDGDKLLFFARGIQGMPRAAQLFTVGAGGGLPTMLPVPYGAMGAISGDGEWLAYTPYTRDNRTWKRYRGGMAADIWLFNLESMESERITDWEGTDTQPMWHGDKLYYLSDAGPAHKLNLWSYEPDGGRHAQITDFTDYDVKWPSMGPGPSGRGEIIFQNGAGLYVLDLARGTERRIEVTIPGARPTLRTQAMDVSKNVDWWSISATGKRALVQARGDIWTLPAEHGSPRNLTRTSGIAEREPSWSPDGRWIAYFGDETGEYELYVTQSDGKGETRQLTEGSATFYNDPLWSPDSRHIAYRDKAAQLYLTTVETGETKVIDKDPWGNLDRPSWSHDSRWLTYTRTDEDHPVPTVRLYDVEADEHHQVTSGMFADASPTFDRKGDYLYFTSARSFRPTYSDVDTTFVYNQSNVLIAVPLRADVEAPWPAETDEEEWSDEEEEGDDEDADEAAGEDDEDEKTDAEGDEDADDDEDAVEPDDGVSGTWEGTLHGGEFPPGLEFVLTLELSSDGSISGGIVVPMGTGTVSGTYDGGTIEGTITTDEGEVADFTGKISGESLTMTVSFQGMQIELKGERTSAPDGGDDDEVAKKDDEAAEVVEIDIEGFEQRAIMLPVKAGNFGELTVNDKNQLLYTRSEPTGVPSIMLFDIDDDKKEEKSVAKGVGGYEMSGDGKKIAVSRGGAVQIQNAAAGATGKSVVTAGMTAHVDPRAEWRQVFIEAWRLQRDFLYVDNMHGVNWNAVREQYEEMLADCVTRADVGYVIREMISEINIGHAYYRGAPGEDEPNVPIGMLGVDWEMGDGAYRVAKVYQGATWDVDARNPFTQSGCSIEPGEYILAVNGVPIDTSKDPWAAFAGTAGRTITLTVSDKPVIDDDARELAVKPAGSEANLRYRAWIESNRAYVAERTGGEVGYIYVPDTGVNGQNNLVRQLQGQLGRKALIIDERWNGGGQIPTRFIEMLNRPVTNYWARRDAVDAAWPPDAHHGPKCMLINGRAGSGGDMFPWLFKQAGLGPTIGTRTWGGLVGISGNPGMIDGSGVTVPTFGFYEKDGTWGVEGHGVDPDIEVIDDPTDLARGIDPQLDVAIGLMLEEIERNPYVRPRRPEAPDRSGMGIPEEDR